MRIAILVRTFDVGGAERQIVALAHGLVQRGHQVLVVVVEAGGTWVPELRIVGASVVEVTEHGIGELPFRVPRLLGSLRRFEPDVLYGQLAFGNVLAGVCRPFLPRTKLVQAILGLRSERDPAAASVRALYWAEAASSRVADAIIANSDAAREQAVRRGLPAGRIHVVNNGIDTQQFRFADTERQAVRAEWSIRDDEVLIGRIGRMRPTKDYPTFLRGAALAAARRPEMRFVVVGDGPERESLEALVRQLGIEDRIVWAGVRVDIPAVMSALDIMVSSSISESSANVIGEAMACGVPCVVTEVGDSAAIVGSTGLAIPTRSPAALAHALLELADLRNLDAARLRSDARARIEALYPLDLMVESTEQVLTNISGGGGANR